MMPARPQSARTEPRRSLGAMMRLGAAASALGLGAGAAWGLPGGSPRFLLLTDPATGEQEASLAHNTSGRYVDRWVRLSCGPSPCVFLKGLGEFELPVAHGEGRFVLREPARLDVLRAAGQLPLTYVADDLGRPTNPNGAMGDVAGACDPPGRVFGLMPHPERFIDATQHPSWPGRLDPSAPGAGLTIFVNAVKATA